MTTPSPVPLPPEAKALLDAPEFATVATIEPDGQPQLSVVWIARDGDVPIFSTVPGRRKTDNLERDPRATLLVYPREQPYSYLEVRGSVEILDDPEGALIDELSEKYRGVPYQGPAEPRVIVRLLPRKVLWQA